MLETPKTREEFHKVTITAVGNGYVVHIFPSPYIRETDHPEVETRVAETRESAIEQIGALMAENESARQRRGCERKRHTAMAAPAHGSAADLLTKEE